MSSVQTQYSPVSPDRRYFIRTARPETMRTAPDYVTATLLPALVRAGYLFNLPSNRWFGSRTPTRSSIPSPRSAAPIPMRLSPLCRVNWRVELKRRPPSIGQPARVQKNATAATTPELAKLLTTSDTPPGIFTVASSLERLETDSPLVPFPVLPIVNQCSYLCECKLLHPRLKPIPCGTAFEIRNRFSKPRTYWNGRFRPVDDATGLGADAAAEFLSRRLSHQPNPSSLSQLPNPVPVPLSLTPL